MSERFAWIYDKTRQAKIWCADMWSRKAVLAIRTAITGITSRLTTIENAGYQTASDVSAAIASAVGDLTELEYTVVQSLPVSGTKGVIYLVPHQHGTRDIYDEYIWINNAFEKIGNTDVDLSQYLNKNDIAAWAKASTKPTYTAAEVGAQEELTTAQLAAVNSGITADDIAVNDASVLCGITPIEPTLTNGSNYASYGGCYYYKYGHRVTVHIGVSNISSKTKTVLWTMPAGFRPKATVVNTGIAIDVQYYSRVRITSDGMVLIYSESAYALTEVSYDAYA